MNHIVVTMTTIYGRARLQVTCDHEHVGWVDLDLGVTVIERPDLAVEIDEAVRDWFATHGGVAGMGAVRHGAA
jgi:hypothetical protein